MGLEGGAALALVELFLEGFLACRLLTAFVRDARDDLMSERVVLSRLEVAGWFKSSVGSPAWIILFTEGLLRRGDKRVTRLCPSTTYLPLDM